MPRKRSNNHLEQATVRLEEAMALLINNQAAFLARASATDERLAELDTRINRELTEIKAILFRHDQILQGLTESIARLPEAVKQRIGLRP